MQSIKHTYTNLHRVFSDIEAFYTHTSELECRGLLVPQFPKQFKELADIFEMYGGVQLDCTRELNYDKLDLPEYNANNVIICFSGGKDSTATAIKYKEMGYNVYLYSVNHINPSFSDETKCAKEIADKLGVPIYIDDIRLLGRHCWMEHPMKNMIIANGALNYGISNGIGTRIVFGNYTTSYLNDNPFDRCAGDCVDMWHSYESIINEIIPNFKIELYLENMNHTLDIITEHRDILDSTLSCLCRHSLRDFRHQWVLEKFGVNLPKRRCGSCYKCCVEYIYMADHKLIDFSKDYYRYCLDKLMSVCDDEGVLIFSIYDLWEHFIFYPIQESKIYDDADRAKVLTRSIKWK